MKALVTGGNGFIGSHLVDELAAVGWRVRVLDLFERRFGPPPAGVEFVKGDMLSDYALREALTGVDVVFHLAWTTIHEIATRDPALDVAMNVLPSIHLIDECRIAGVSRLVFFSSGGTVYGLARYLPVDEQHPTDPISAYGITKLAIEKYLGMYRHLYGLNYVVLRPSVPFGPGQDPRRRQGAVNVFLHRIAHGMPIEIWGDGSVVRDYFYISDLISAAVAAATIPGLEGGHTLNIGGGVGYSLNELIRIVEDVTHQRAIVEYQPSRRFDVPSLVLDASRAQTVLDWTPKVELAVGIAHTYDWLVSLDT